MTKILKEKVDTKKDCQIRQSLSGAENETRTRDPDLGKVVLYQLSYFRIFILKMRYFRLHLGIQTSLTALGLHENSAKFYSKNLPQPQCFRGLGLQR